MLHFVFICTAAVHLNCLHFISPPALHLHCCTSCALLHFVICTSPAPCSPDLAARTPCPARVALHKSPCPWLNLPPPLSLRVALALLSLCNAASDQRWSQRFALWDSRSPCRPLRDVHFKIVLLEIHGSYGPNPVCLSRCLLDVQGSIPSRVVLSVGSLVHAARSCMRRPCR